MSQVIQTNGNYTIKTSLGGVITLNTGPEVGNVVITGNLTVLGNSTSVDVGNLSIEDNVITLNKNETGNGVTIGYSGFEIHRGIADKVSFVFDEASDTWLLSSGSNGSYYFADQSNLKLRKIVFTDPSDPDSIDLTLENVGGFGTGVFRVTGTDTYEDNVLHDDDIPNKRYVDRRIFEKPTYQIVRDDSRVTVQDLQDPDDPLLLESRVVTVVDNNLILAAYANRVEIQNLQFYTNVIENPTTNENVHIATSGTGKLEIDYAIQYNHALGTPASVPGTTMIYGSTPSPEGGTGVYYSNETNNGELISKRKALTFSLIF